MGGGGGGSGGGKANGARELEGRKKRRAKEMVDKSEDKV